MAEVLALDSSCLVALACTWHDRHADVLGCLVRARARDVALLVPGHVLLETYALLTRLPPPHQVAPGQALAFLEANSGRWRTTGGLDAAQAWALLRACTAGGIAGGQAYDALIATCALRDGATAIATLNPKHFMKFEALGLAVESIQA